MHSDEKELEAIVDTKQAIFCEAMQNIAVDATRFYAKQCNALRRKPTQIKLMQCKRSQYEAMRNVAMDATRFYTKQSNELR
jgi:hypothetical protein